MAEPIEQAPAWVRAAAAAHASDRDRQRAEAQAEIAKWKRGEPSRVMTFEKLFAWLDALDAADEDAGGTGSHAADPGPLGRKDG
jgi:hypothetical protein